MGKALLKERNKVWRDILAFLSQCNEPEHSAKVAAATNLITDTAYHRLNQLAVEQMVRKINKPFGKLTIFLWEITEKGREWLKQPQT